MSRCTHQSKILLKRYDRCEIDETDPISHTSVVVLGCPRCHELELFPPNNAARITERYRAIIRADLARNDWIWKEPVA